jgi:hypothetical protein
VTYDKLGTGEAPLVGIGFNELAYERTGAAVLTRTGGAAVVLPTQRRNVVISARVGSGSALRVQTSTATFDAAGPQDPLVTFTGICHHPYAENVTEGKSMKVRVDLDTGDELVIDMAHRTVKVNDEMVWGYTGRWFQVTPGDVVRAGAEGIGAGFSAEIVVNTVGGLVTKPEAGVGALDGSALGRPEIAVSRFGGASSPRSGTGSPNGRGRAYSERVASGSKAVQS